MTAHRIVYTAVGSVPGKGPDRADGRDTLADAVRDGLRNLHAGTWASFTIEKRWWPG